MKATLLVAIFFAALVAAQLGPGDHKLTITGRPEGTRTFHVHVPQTYTTVTAISLVFAWHGLGNKCEEFGSKTSYSTTADKNGFIVVYPCGVGLAPAFNAGVCCQGIEQTDDFEFARLMIAKIRDNWPKVNVSRIFTSGYSNGGMMSEVLACKMHGVFRGAVSVSGVTTLNPGNTQAFDECDKFYANNTRPVAVLKIHGTADPTVPWNGNPLLRFPPIPADHKRWAQRNKCTGNPIQTFKQGVYSNEVYPAQNCKGFSQVELLTVQGGVHHWPNDPDFRAAEYAWKFFSSLN
jgi:poly(3-hydroxybutyrate) depolymerase